MDKDLERSFLETLSRALIALPFDLKVLLEAVADPDLDHGVRELAAAAVVHIITPKDGNVEPATRFTEDVVLLRLALTKIFEQGGEGAPAFKERFSENASRLDEDLATFRTALGSDVVDWLDGRFPALKKAVYSKKKIPMFVDDEELGTFLYDEGLRFATEYPISEKTLASKMKQAQPIVDHLARKREQDRKKIPSAG